MCCVVSSFHVCGHICTYANMWRLEVRLRYSSRTVHLVLWQSLPGIEACRSGEAAWERAPGILLSLPLQCWSYQHAHLYLAFHMGSWDQTQLHMACQLNYLPTRLLSEAGPHVDQSALDLPVRWRVTLGSCPPAACVSTACDIKGNAGLLPLQPASACPGLVGIMGCAQFDAVLVLCMLNHHFTDWTILYPQSSDELSLCSPG